MTAFWDAWAPYWELLEERHFGAQAASRIERWVESPALVVGAGLGVVVEHLRRGGHDVTGLDASREMIAAARRRRGLELALGDAAALPFADGAYRTVILSSGVADYEPEEARVRTYVAEGRRVLAPGGSLLIGFYRFAPELERVYRKLGVIAGGRYHLGRLFEIGETVDRHPLLVVPKIARWSGRSPARSLATWTRLGLLRPPSFREEERVMRHIYGLAAADGVTRRELHAGLPASLPYRDEREVLALLSRCGLARVERAALADCLVVRHVAEP